MNTRVHLSTLVLMTIGMFDLVSTMLLMQIGVREGNPLFASLVGYGSLAFVGGKMLFLVGPVLLLEYVRLKKPDSAEIGTWTAASLYALLYVGHLTMMR